MSETNAELLRDAELPLVELINRGNKDLQPALDAVQAMQRKVRDLQQLARTLEQRFADNILSDDQFESGASQKGDRELK